ncbi:iron response transcriptional regulator IrrA [Sneathiella limimaris]|uniref:iron response transcriptional regulator IrrA n=1 Tax=Sneathiella limimaris TaxID=1964213 RepID=UPI00146A3068|nr:Fur family transcriptional regulator [Sneathiella limimaris]
MTKNRQDVEDRLKQVNLRATRQRLALADLLFSDGHRHITAEQLHSEALNEGVKISLATIYNNLHQFTQAGLLREVIVDPSRSYFDTNTSHHHHVFHEVEGTLQDIPANALKVSGIPDLPKDTEINSVDVIVRVRKKSS